MDGQWVAQVTAWHKGGGIYLQSFHFDFPPESVIAQISLSERTDFYSLDPVLYLGAKAWFTGYTTADGKKHDLTEYFDADGNPKAQALSSFMANNLTGFSGYLSVGNCSAQAIINVFVWPSVSS